MKVLVMGAGGYLGIPLVEALVERGHEVTAVDRWFFGKYPAGSPTQPRCEKGDIRTYVSKEPYDAVIDLCGLSNDASCEIDPELTRSINSVGAKLFANHAKDIGVKRYIYASSCAVYGDNLDAHEESELKPLTLYADCKVAVEDHLRQIADSTFKPVILRNATVFGVAPRMRFDLAVNAMTKRAWAEQLIYVMGGGEQWRPFVHIRDVVRVFAFMLDQGQESTFNVGYDSLSLHISELARIVQAHFPHAKTHRIPDDPDKRSYRVSFARLASLLANQWSGVDQGIEEIRAALDKTPGLATDPTTMTVAYYKSLLEWESRLNSIRLDGKVL